MLKGVFKGCTVRGGNEVVKVVEEVRGGRSGRRGSMIMLDLPNGVNISSRRRSERHRCDHIRPSLSQLHSRPYSIRQKTGRGKVRFLWWEG